MLTAIARFRSEWLRGNEIKARIAHSHTDMSQTLIVPAGSAIVRPQGMAIDMDVIPSTTQASRLAIESSEPAPITPTIDIVSECMATGRAYALLAGQQLGKTHVARHIAARWASEGREVWFVGPKWCFGEWGESVTMWGPDWPQIEEGLKALLIEAKERREAAISGQRRTQDCPPRLIVIDDWTEVAQSLGEHAQRFVVSATTMFASVNLIPLFCGHADTSAAWGTDRVGKALTENFLRIRVHRDQAGEREYGILYPAQVERRKEGQLIYPQYGFIPNGEAVWPDESETSSETEPETPPVEPDSPGTRSESPGFHRQVSNEVSSLPKAPPKKVEVKDRRNWRQFELDHEDGAIARRVYERRQSISDVAESMKSIGATKGVRISLAKAILHIPSPNYTILEA